MSDAMAKRPGTGWMDLFKAMEKKCGRDKLPPKEDVPVISQAVFTPEEQRKLLYSMKCAGDNCSTTPNPMERYLCEDGHLFCYECACLIEMDFDGRCVADPRSKEKETKTGEGQGKGNDGQNQKKNKAPEDNFCNKSVEPVPCDPFYKFIYMKLILEEQNN